MADVWGKLSLNNTISSSKIVAYGGSIGGWRIICILNVYIFIHYLKTRTDYRVWRIIGDGLERFHCIEV